MTTETLTETRPFEPTTPIKPSEAIRLGCLVLPIQAIGDMGTGSSGCVARAHYHGGGDGTWDRTASKPCPVCGCNYYTALSSVAVHLNDEHHWSRERIADWLEGLGL